MAHGVGGSGACAALRRSQGVSTTRVLPAADVVAPLAALADLHSSSDSDIDSDGAMEVSSGDEASIGQLARVPGQSAYLTHLDHVLRVTALQRTDVRHLFKVRVDGVCGARVTV